MTQDQATALLKDLRFIQQLANGTGDAAERFEMLARRVECTLDDLAQAGYALDPQTGAASTPETTAAKYGLGATAPRTLESDLAEDR